MIFCKIKIYIGLYRKKLFWRALTTLIGMGKIRLDVAMLEYGLIEMLLGELCLRAQTGALKKDELNRLC